MRIIGGIYRGKPLITPEGNAIRPTSERAREAVFTRLMHSFGNPSPLIGGTILDLCCGTGAMGLEAMSRGAAHTTFIDITNKSIAIAKKNAAALGVENQCSFITTDARKLPDANTAVDIIFCDPPYDAGMEHNILSQLHTHGWLEENTLLIMEMALKNDWAEELSETQWDVDIRKYGKTKVAFIEAAN